MQCELKTAGADPQTDLLGKLPWLQRLPSAAEVKALRQLSQFDGEGNPLNEAAKQYAQIMAEVKAIKEAAEEDKHTIFSPTHVALRNGEIIGCASIGQIPLLILWMHSEKASPRESMAMLNQVEAAAHAQGWREICIACGSDSNFRQPLEKAFGYQCLMQADFMVKDLTTRKKLTI